MNTKNRVLLFATLMTLTLTTGVASILKHSHIAHALTRTEEIDDLDSFELAGYDDPINFVYTGRNTVNDEKRFDIYLNNVTISSGDNEACITIDNQSYSTMQVYVHLRGAENSLISFDTASIFVTCTVAGILYPGDVNFTFAAMCGEADTGITFSSSDSEPRILFEYDHLSGTVNKFQDHCDDDMSDILDTEFEQSRTYYFHNGNDECEFSESDFTEPTCTQDGVLIEDCYYCMDRHITRTPAYGHSKVEIERIEPTETEPGYIKYECEECGEIITEEMAPAHEHSYEIIDKKEASCETEGHITYKCSECGDEYTETIEATNHNYQMARRVEPTCTQDGSVDYECTNCHDVNTEVLPATGHNFNQSEWIVDEAATCTEDGSAHRVCGNPGCDEIEEMELKARGHVFDNYEMGKESTCITPGYMFATCNECGEEVYEYLELNRQNHEGSLLLVIDVAPTETSEGYGHYVWSCCGEFDSDTVIPALTPETSLDLVTDIVGVDLDNIDPENMTPVEEAFESISTDTLLEIGGSSSKTFEEISRKLSNKEITDEEYSAYCETIAAATEGAVIAGSKADNVEEESQAIQTQVAASCTINMGDKLSAFYELQYNLILGKEKEKVYPNSLNRAEGAEESGIDYTEGADVYKKVNDFIDNTVDHMTDMVMMVRECSHEKVAKGIETYVDVIGVRSFRSFDKEKADMEFAEAAYQAILGYMQEQSIFQLDKEYEENSAKLTGIAKENLEKLYKEQKEICEDIESFEILVVETMRRQYNAILDYKFQHQIINATEYESLYVGDSEEELIRFKDIYKYIFYGWALGKDAESYGYTDDYGITLEELTSATLDSVGLGTRSINVSDSLSSTEIAMIAIFGSIALIAISGITVVLIHNRRKGVDI